jgi:HSP20 family protein
MSQDDLEITMADAATLTIKGARKEPASEGAKWHRRERGFGSFERSLELPGPVDTENVEATCKHGVLTIKLPKAPELRPRKIEVKAS